MQWWEVRERTPRNSPWPWVCLWREGDSLVASDASVAVRSQVRVPAEETTYWCAVRLLPEMTRKHHIIQASLNANLSV